MSYGLSYLILMDKLEKKFSAIYDQCIGKIYRFIFIKVNSQEIAEDLCSETFLRGWEALKKSENPGLNNTKIENPSAFLYQIARNLVVDYYREKAKTQTISAEFVQITDPRFNLEEKAIAGSDLDMVRGALAGIKDDYREVIVWHYLDDLKIPEIAKILDKSEETVRVLLHRAMKKLKVELS